MNEDADLLRRYVSDRSESAFTELVRRRIDLVYSVAVRQVGGDTHLAEDVTQKVFADLARKAPTLLDRPVLSGWLYRSTQFAASDVVRSERRRRAREQETFLMHETTSSADAPTDWDRLRPILDQAMGELTETERDAIALRFFEGRAFADIGRALQLTEEAARKRVERALDKMAAGLSRRGVTSTTGAVGAALAYQTAVAAPAGLATTVAGSALSGVGAGGAVTAGAGILEFMSSTKITMGAVGIAALAVGAAVYGTNKAQQHADALAALNQQHASLQTKLADAEQQLTASVQRLEVTQKRAAAAEEDNAKLLTAIRNQSAARTAASGKGTTTESEPLTHDAVEIRYRRGQDLAKTGDPAEALRELLWCFDEGMPRVTGYGGVRMSFLLSAIDRLGERYPPALAALRERRDKAEKRLLVSATDYDATSTFSAINRVLKEPERTLAIFDQLPPDDRRRSTLAMTAFDALLDAKRYADALQGRTFGQMTQQFDRGVEERPIPANSPNPEGLRKSQLDYLVSSTAKHVEALAGAEKLEQARTLAGKLLAHDRSTETRATLQRHAERAGQADLLKGL